MIMEKQNKKNGTFGRLLRYIYKNYRVYMITVIICIIIAAAASVVQTIFLQRLIDTCILPGLENGFESIRQPFMQTILSMVTLYVFGVAAAFTYTHLMATVTQGTLKHLRVDMFDKMQSLPIKYFLPTVICREVPWSVVGWRRWRSTRVASWRQNFPVLH